MIKRPDKLLSLAPQGDIRQGKETDSEQLLSVEKLCFDRYYKPHRFTVRQFKSYINDGKRLILVATSQSLLVGYIAGIFRSLLAHIDSVAVTPTARKGGIGTRLMQKFIHEARQRNCAQITLEVAAANQEGQAFFARLGFVKYRQIPSYYGPHSDAIKMRLIL